MAGSGLTPPWILTNTGGGVASGIGLGDCSGSEPSKVSKERGAVKEVQGQVGGQLGLDGGVVSAGVGPGSRVGLPRCWPLDTFY